MNSVGEDIKRANDELRKLPERPKKVEEPKPCAACGSEKPRGNYSKAQWKASLILSTVPGLRRRQPERFTVEI